VSLTHEEVYQRLAREYNYTPSEIADMTPYQQFIMLNGEPKSSTVMFDSLQAYLAGMNKNV